jgi:hypothetical protein
MILKIQRRFPAAPTVSDRKQSNEESKDSGKFKLRKRRELCQLNPEIGLRDQHAGRNGRLQSRFRDRNERILLSRTCLQNENVQTTK